jgi:hypothetical protein
LGPESTYDLALKPLIARDDCFPFRKPAHASKYFEQEHGRIERHYMSVAQLIVKAICEFGSKEFPQEG